jgi:hypothetical protein
MPRAADLARAGLLLLSLAASALHAILSLVVSQRTREIGVRVARRQSIAHCS